jgi:mitochondrial distribution and morphology protein 31
MSKSISSALFGRHLRVPLGESVNGLPCRFTLRQQRSSRASPRKTSSHIPSNQRPIHMQRPSQWFRRANTYSTKQSFTGGGLLLIGLGSSPPSSSSAVVSSCSAAADSALCGVLSQKSNFSHLARQAWQRGNQQSYWVVAKSALRRYKSSEPEGRNSSSAQKQDDPKAPEKGDVVPPEPEVESLTQSVSKYLHLPKIPHRPTKEELLAAANGFWERLKVRFKWVSIRSMRPWNVDEWGAFVSWFLFGHLVWILVGTTTFFSILIFSINTVFAQGMFLLLESRKAS